MFAVAAMTKMIGIVYASFFAMYLLPVKILPGNNDL
jgi:hypothetical protein